MSKNEGSSSNLFSKSLEKGLRILDLFPQENVFLNLKEISRKTDLNWTSTCRYVNTLIQLGYLCKDSETKMLRLGPKVLSMSFKVGRNLDILSAIAPPIEDIYKKINMTIEVALFDDDSLVVIYRKEAKDTLIFRYPTIIKSLHCTCMGKAFLAGLPEKEKLASISRLDLEKRTKYSIADVESLLFDLEKTKKRGYSLNNEEYIPGLIGICAPLFNRVTNRPAGAVSFASSTIQNSIQSIEQKYSKIIVSLAQDISDSMSHLI
ncbi:MAG: IclR family transcriptional regulator [Candidatus Aminicenantes bacterium]|nr:IclR family transcriptional regulator [Candidatus Aminicenantes bacterium]